MPISRDEFDKGKLDLSLYIIWIFRSASDTAFTADEISNFLESQERKIPIQELDLILTDLVKKGKLEASEVGGVIHYIYNKRPLGFRRG